VRSPARALGVTFGSRNALALMKDSLADSAANPGERRAALDALLGAKEPTLAPTLRALLKDEQLRGPALRGLAVYDDPEAPAAILANYASLPRRKRRTRSPRSARDPPPPPPCSTRSRAGRPG
jgi:HEAT repeat protein